jgi:hypothetical protein
LGTVELDALVPLQVHSPKFPKPRLNVSVWKQSILLKWNWLTADCFHVGLLVEIQIADMRRPVLVAVGADGEKPVVGYTTLENLGFKVNPITRLLERARPIEY